MGETGSNIGSLLDGISVHFVYNRQSCHDFSLTQINKEPQLTTMATCSVCQDQASNLR